MGRLLYLPTIILMQNVVLVNALKYICDLWLWGLHLNIYAELVGLVLLTCGSCHKYITHDGLTDPRLAHATLAQNTRQKAKQ